MSNTNQLMNPRGYGMVGTVIRTLRILLVFLLAGVVHCFFTSQKLSAQNDWTWIGSGISGSSAHFSEDGRRVFVHNRAYEFDGITWAPLGKDGKLPGAVSDITPDGERVLIFPQVYEYDGEAWVALAGKIPDGSAVSLSADGTRVAVGDSEASQVRIYEHNGSDWVQLGSDINGKEGDRTGHAVSLSGDGTRLAVGAPDHNDFSYEYVGQIRLYEYDGSDWVQLGQNITGGFRYDRLGSNALLSANGKRLVIAEPSAILGPEKIHIGQVRILEFDGNDWGKVGEFTGETGGDRLGSSVSISSDGSRIAIGSSGNDANGRNAGRVQVFQQKSNSWKQVGSNLEGVAKDNEIGTMVALSGNGKWLAIRGSGAWGGLRIFSAEKVPLAVSRLVLVNTSTNQEIRELSPQDEITLEDFNGFGIGIRADVQGEAESVVLTGEGFSPNPRTENQVPYAVGGQKDGRVLNIKDQLRAVDELTITATPYPEDNGQGEAGHTATFTLKINKTPPHITNLFLVNTNNGRDIRKLNPEDQIDLADFPGIGLSIRAEVEGLAGSVVFTGSGFSPNPRVENIAPYALGGKSNGQIVNIKGQFLAGNTLTVRATPYLESKGRGQSGETITVSIKIVGDAGQEGFWVKIGQDIDGKKREETIGWDVSLSADGSRVAMSCYNVSRVYEYNGSEWVQIGTDLGGGIISLSANGKRLAIGNSSSGENGYRAGRVSIYEYNGSTWTKLGGDIYGKASEDQLGKSVSLSANGSRVAIGAPGSYSSSRSGYVRVYTYDGQSWKQLGSSMNGKATRDYYGETVSLSADGNRVAIGSPGSENGLVEAYEYNNQDWVQLGEDFTGIGSSISLSASGHRLAIGAPGAAWYSEEPELGQARIFEYTGQAWMQLGKNIIGETVGDGSGEAVSLSTDGNRVAIGASGNDGDGHFAGHVRVYEYKENTWIQKGADIDGEGDYDRSGKGLCLSADGNQIAIGAPLNDGKHESAGHVRVYELEETPSDFSVTRLFLVNTNTNEDIRVLSAEDEINLSDFEGTGLSIRAEVEGKVGSVIFTGNSFSPNPKTENIPPYALGGDEQGNFNNIKPQFQAGNTLTITATPYAEDDGQGQAGQMVSSVIQITDNLGGFPRLVLVNTANQETLRLLEGATISANDLDERGIVLQTQPVDATSERFDFRLNQQFVRYERLAPYSLTGDDTKTGNIFSLSDDSKVFNLLRLSGENTLRVLGEEIDLRANFTITGGSQGAQALVYPVPLSGNVVFVKLSDSVSGEIQYTIRDEQGNILSQGRQVVREGQETLELALLTSLEKGTFYLDLSGSDLPHEIHRLVKE